MPILVNITYETFKPHDGDVTDCDERGYVEQNKNVTFRELIEMLRGGESSSSSSPTYGDPSDWVTHYGAEHNYRTGETTDNSIHFSRDNPPSAEKYWRLAFKKAGVT